jgi:hypothetical protein
LPKSSDLKIDISKVGLGDDLFGSDITPVKVTAWATNDSPTGFLPSNTATVADFSFVSNPNVKVSATDDSINIKQDETNTGEVDSSVPVRDASLNPVSVPLPVPVPTTVSDHPVDALGVTLTVTKAASLMRLGHHSVRVYSNEIPRFA